MSFFRDTCLIGANKRIGALRASDLAVSVLLVTYNQVAYVTTALNGLLRQQTSFGFEVLVHDDCSTDGTLQVLESYQAHCPDVIRLFPESRNRFKEFKCGYFTEVLAPNATGRYVALCEGDDYWTDRLKLQRQFDYMEAHAECSECNHAALRIDMVTGAKDIMGMGSSERDLGPDEIIREWNVPTASRFIRKSMLEGYVEEWTFDKIAGDFPLAVYLGMQGRVHYDPTVMSAYRFRVPHSYSRRASSSDCAAAVALRWLAMLEQIDNKTSRAYHREIAHHVRAYAKMAMAHSEGNVELPGYALGVMGVDAQGLIDGADGGAGGQAG